MNMRQIVSLIAVLFILACSEDTQKTDDGMIDIVCTTGMIADMVQNIAGDRANVTGLMGPGVDPHLYKASQGDINSLNSAEIIFYNGLHLEGKMVDIFEKMNRTKPVVAVAAPVDSSVLMEYGETVDPHIWFDVSLWREAGGAVLTALTAYDSSSAEYFTSNYKNYMAKLDSLHRWVGDTLQVIPAERRVLVTAHDAFSYFGRAYDIEVVGLQGISTVAEFGVNDITRLVNMIVERQIKAIFVESSISPRSIKAVQEGVQSRGFDVQIGGTLYSDAMGEPGSNADTYIAMVRHNVRTLVEALH